MTYPPPGGTPDADPHQPSQHQPPPYEPSAYQPPPYQAAPYQAAPYQPTDPPAAPASGAPATGAPATGAPAGGQPSYPPPFGSPSAPPFTQDPYGAQTPYGMQQPYGAHPYGAGYGAPQRTNPLAIVSLVCSLAGLVTCISAPVGIVLGHIAKRQIRQTGEQGAGLATAGLWAGYIITGLGLLFVAFWIVVIVGGVMNSDTTY